MSNTHCFIGFRRFFARKHCRFGHFTLRCRVCKPPIHYADIYLQAKATSTSRFASSNGRDFFRAGRAMFVVIVCTNCQGASQVEEAVLGQPRTMPSMRETDRGANPRGDLAGCQADPGTAAFARRRSATSPSAESSGQLRRKVIHPKADREQTTAKPKRSPLWTAIYTTGSLL